MDKTKGHHLRSRLILAIFIKLFNGFGLERIEDIFTLSKTSAICVKENNMSSSLMVGSVGYHILY